MICNDPIGIFDSGIGGLTVASAVQQELPNETIYYVGDTARCPYGDRSPEEVTQFSYEICDFLIRNGVKMLVVACNTVTAVALPKLAARYTVPVLGVIQPGARAAIQGKHAERIGVIGTSVTIASGAYESAIQAQSPGVAVFSVACPRFVPLVEQGRFVGDEVRSIVQDSLSELTKSSIDTLILGCTHYPLLEPVIGAVMGRRVRLISSAKETAREVKMMVEQNIVGRRNDDGVLPRHRYCTSGDPDKMRVALRQWLRLEDSQFAVDMVSLNV